jgi:serine/threonine-protein kinase
MLPGFSGLELLARGGMGGVYRAVDLRSQRTVAVKVVDASQVLPEAVARFEREALILARLQHPHIITTLDQGRHGDLLYLTMPLAMGSLESRRDQFAQEPRAAVVLMEKVARALHYAHEQEVLHRDLKPANILLDDQGEPLIADFGLAKAALGDQSLSYLAPPLGTPLYLSPERILGAEPGPASDVWGLGVVLYELLTGQRPFSGDTPKEIWDKVLLAAPVPLRTCRPAIEPALEAIVGRCLRRAPEDRYPTAKALADDLHRYLRGRPLAPELNRRRKGWRLSLRRAAVIFGACLTMVLGLGVSLTPFSPKPEDRPAALVERLRRGESVALLGEKAPPAWYRWHVGAGELDEFWPLELDSGGWSILELLPEIPCDRYRLKGEVRIRTNHVARAGFFFSYRNLQGKEGADMRFTVASCSRSVIDTSAHMLLMHVGKNEADHRTFHGVQTLCKKELTEAEVDDCHRLAVEVAPDQMRLYWDGVMVGSTTPEKVAFYGLCEIRREKVEEKDVNVPAFQGPIGLFVHDGSAQFRNVVIEPLPE